MKAKLFVPCLAAILSLFADSETPRPSHFQETLYAEWGQTFLMGEELFRQKTDFQDLVIFQNPLFGKVLALDGIIQTTEADEAIYHEMLAHVPLLTHDNPKSVLIIGGGDGGMLREVLKHTTVEKAVLVDIDSAVIELSKKHLPSLSKGAFEDPRVKIVIQDATEYVKNHQNRFDVIICDSTDPIGPGKVLFTSEFYGNCKALLNRNGIFVNQNGVPFLQPDELGLTKKNREPHFKNVTFYTATVPTYAGGPMAFGWASDKKYRVSESVLQDRLEKRVRGNLFYYNAEVHKAAFALPNYILKRVE